MSEAFFRAFLTILLMELGSASQITLAAMTSSSKNPMASYVGGLTAFIVSCLLALVLSNVIERIPFNVNVISGTLLMATGAVILWKS